jgi:hypothetical protein
MKIDKRIWPWITRIFLPLILCFIIFPLFFNNNWEKDAKVITEAIGLIQEGKFEEALVICKESPKNEAYCYKVILDKKINENMIITKEFCDEVPEVYSKSFKKSNKVSYEEEIYLRKKCYESIN